MADADTQEKISQLQALEHNLQNFLLQKQTFQSQLLEIESAMSELQQTDTAYKIVGNIMVKADKQALQKELDDKQGLVGLRIKALEKQEAKLKEEASRKQAEVLADMKKK
ncbi:prefoldin subunit beta [Candidatus Woesearchaeota archaeon]|nr:prefoldin subunit beta [Candidatus Woesearchaeota archaeon]